MGKKTPYFFWAFLHRQFSSLSFLCCKVKSSRIPNKGCTDLFFQRFRLKYVSKEHGMKTLEMKAVHLTKS